MIRFSAGTDYALRAMLELAKRDPDFVKIQDIVAAQHLPADYVATLLGRLTQRGLVLSKRGPHGGYALARPPQAVTIGEVVAAVDGPLPDAPRIALAVDERLELSARMSTFWGAVGDSVRRFIDEMTIAQLLAGDVAKPDR